MKKLNQFIIEKLKLSKNDIIKNFDIDDIDIKILDDLLEKKNKNILGKFLKGTEYKKSINICFLNSNKYLHIFRYSDMHYITLSMIYNDNSEWPKESEWSSSNKIVYDELDDRSPIKNLFDKFYKFLKANIK